MRLLGPAKKESVELKKNVGLIHSANKLSLLERKIANALLFNAYDTLLIKDEHQVHVSDLAKLIGYNSNDHKIVKQSLMSLMSTVLEWNILDKDLKETKNVWVASTMLADAKIEGPMCTYSYSKRMRELCHHPEVYARLNMQELANFKSTYGIALYENCVRYKSISQTQWFDMELFRKLMGVEAGKYETFRDFNKRVISPAVKEVNAHSSIQVQPEFEKSGRVVSRIKFLIGSKSEKSIDEITVADEKNNTLHGKLVAHYGFAEHKVASLLKEYSETYLVEKMSIIESSKSYLAGKIENLAKYFEKALREDFQAPKSSKEIVNHTNELRQKNILELKLTERKKEEYSSYQRKAILDAFQVLQDKIKKEIEKHFEKIIKDTAYHRAFVTKGGIQDPLICDRFVEFLKSNHKEVLSSVMSFSEFCR